MGPSGRDQGLGNTLGGTGAWVVEPRITQRAAASWAVQRFDSADLFDSDGYRTESAHFDIERQENVTAHTPRLGLYRITEPLTGRAEESSARTRVSRWASPEASPSSWRRATRAWSPTTTWPWSRPTRSSGSASTTRFFSDTGRPLANDVDQHRVSIGVQVGYPIRFD
jgi:hypothetical protein